MSQLILPDVTAITRETQEFLDSLKGKQVETQEEYNEALEICKDIKRRRRVAEEFFKPSKDNAFNTHREICKMEKTAIEPLDNSERVFKNLMTKFIQEQNRIRAEAERKAQQEAQRVAEEERLREAEHVEKHLGREAADALLDDPVVAPVISIEPVTKGAGVSMPKTYSAKVTDFRKFLEGILAGKIPINAVVADTKFLNNQARALKENLNYPGVELVIETNLTIRTGS